MHAPDDVRRVIESWVVEPACVVPLEVRVMPTPGGLYVTALSDGRVLECVVADAEAAGAIVASWAAGDREARPRPAPPSSAPPVATAPVDSAPAPAPVEVESAAPARASSSRWFTAGGIVSPATRGLYAEVDILALGAWNLSVGASVATTDRDLSGGAGQFHSQDGSLIFDIGRTFSLGPVDLRATLGAGVVGTSASVMSGGGTAQLVGSAPVFQASLLASHPISAAWAVTGGVVFTQYDQRFEGNSPQDFIERSDLEGVLLAALRHRL